MKMFVYFICFFIITAAGGHCSPYPDTLTSEEISWLQYMSAKEIRYVIPPRFTPISFIENGQADGIAKDYLNLLKDILGLEFKLMDVSWQKGMDLGRQAEVDFFPCLSNTPEREEFLLFTKDSYISFSLVIVSQKGAAPIRSIPDLKNKRVAVDRDLVAYSKLKKDYPELNIDFVFRKTNPNCLKAVHLGEADACLSSSAVSGYLISKNGWSNLKISGETGWSEARMKMGVRKDWPIFISILDKTLAYIPKEAMSNITKKWIPVQFEHSFDSIYVLKRILPFFAAGILVLIFVTFFLVFMIQKNKQLRIAEDTIKRAFHELNKAKNAADEAARAKTEFLDNSGQCFLSFGKKMNIDPEYSLECKKIFEMPITGKPIESLLFQNNPTLQKQFKRNMDLILSEDNELKQDLYMSLLKPLYRLGNKHIKAEYRLIANKKMMLILTNITRQKTLEDEVTLERNRLKFVVSAVRESIDFFQMIDDMKKFKDVTLPGYLNAPDLDTKTALSHIYRHLHTFKGLFSQQGFIYFPDFLHDMETKTAEMLHNAPPDFKEAQKFVELFQKETVLEKDLEIIKDFLGETFMDRKGEVPISTEQAARLKAMAQKLLDMESDVIDSETRALLEEFICLRYVNLKQLLNAHADGAIRMAQRIGKYISPFQAKGDDIMVDPDTFIPFTRSLVHVFRNAVDHGIEHPDHRVETGKNEYGSITCQVINKESYVYISISDDGSGVDMAALRAKALKNKMLKPEESANLTDSILLDLLFTAEFTTKETPDQLSGRGIGLNAVQEELHKINGAVSITTRAEKGTTFEFKIPFQNAS